MITVYHNSKFLDYTFDQTNSTLKTGVFELVATVDTESLDEAYQLTNNIDNSWITNPGVDPLYAQDKRSTSVGDLLRDGQGDYYVVESAGFRKLNFEFGSSLFSMYG